MAGVTQINTWVQARLVAWLRWRIFLNTLRSPGAKAEMVARIVVSILGSVIGLGLAFGLGAIAYAMMGERPQVVGILLWVVFLVGQFLPLIISATSSNFDTRSLLRFPLRFSTFVLLALSYSIFDPAVLSSLLWLSSVGIGAALARPAAAHWIAAAVGLLAIAAALLNRLLLSWVERLMARRRSREILFLTFIFGMLSVQLVGAALQRWEPQFRTLYETLRPVLNIAPPGLAAGVVIATAGATGSNGMLLLALSLWSVLLFGLLHKRLRAQYRGEEISESVTVLAKKSAPTQSSESFVDKLPFLTGQRAALLGKEFRYLLRNAVTMLQLCVPFFLILFFGLIMNTKGKDFSFFQRRPEAILPAAIGYSVFISLPIAHNSLSFESWGLQLLLMAPVRFREVFLAKNLALGFAIYGQGLLVLAMVQAMFGSQSAVMAVAAFTGLLFILLANFTIGNLLSVCLPRAFDFGSFRQRQSAWTVIAGMLTQIVGMVMVYLVYAVAAWRGNTWWAVLGYVVMSAAMWQVYLLVLDRCEEIAHQRREFILTEICRN